MQSPVDGAFVPSQKQSHILIPLTRRVKGYIRFVGKYVTGRRKRF